ncbi:MAG: prepilin peptidase [Gemmatimonadota bacterium]|jgi:leader peptidase (prepilin peptidase)/N-methyltransferase|nr:prepilin peptidase [Gemmatimonadota bacterium]MDP6461938.1 prepilin peptidase [Gemmatimonadota bacterium]MDP6529291.1 prepilin peptidase [Gemmatimonadota bacterium]MDP6802176.1 prepilin peptidase [Gemmatimonadota bacterium]MDP7031506.1 prepilin peptidase [Gemmatimonadota bacterium]
MTILVLVLLGMAVGSFLNVVIHRVPRGESVVRPRSRCTRCAHPVRPMDNIPIVSWVFLRGRCRNCGTRISSRYPMVEAATALLFAGAAVVLRGPVELVPALVFVAAMMAVTFIDLDHMIIPDSITLPGILLGILAASLGWGIAPLDAVLGVLAGGGSLLAVGSIYRFATGRDGLGAGDIKLLAMVGAFLGPSGAFLTILAGSLAGTLVAAVGMARGGLHRTSELPFGAFLAPGAVVVLFFGGRLVALYWGLVS